MTKKKKKNKKNRRVDGLPAGATTSCARKRKGKGNDMAFWQKINGRYVQSDEPAEEGPEERDWSDDPAEVNAAIMAQESKKIDKKPTSISRQGAIDFRGDFRNDYGYGGGYTGKGYHSCGHDGEQVFRINETVYGGGKQSKLDVYEMDVILDASGMKLDGGSKAPFIMSTSAEWNKVNEFIEQPAEHVALRWPDQKAPPVQFRAWPEILRLTLQYGYVVACCVGGHGRTGTILACLLIAAGYSAEAALKVIHGHYCSEAVETKTQEEYLAGLEAWMRANNIEGEYNIEILAEPVKPKYTHSSVSSVAAPAAR